MPQPADGRRVPVPAGEHDAVVKPRDARLWHETVLALSDHHVLGQPWNRPTLR